MKPGFENFFRLGDGDDDGGDKSLLDTDLDGEIYADQLHSLLQRISPEMEALMSRLPTGNDKVIAAPLKPIDAAKRTDEETIWDRIHGTFVATADSAGSGKAGVKKLQPRIGGGGGGVFEGVFQGPKVFRQSVMTQMVRKPDGSYESRRTVLDADGRTSTTVTRTTADGRTETITSDGCGSGGGGGGGGAGGGSIFYEGSGTGGMNAIDRNIYVTKEGYAMPKNIW